MLLYHVAKILEISGFALASIFGGIFLSREVTGDFASKLDTKITNMSIRLTNWSYKRFLPLAKYSILIAEHEVPRQIMSGIVVRGLTLVIAVSGLTFEISWLFWLGLALASVYALLTAIGTLMRVIYLSKKHKSWTYLLLYPVMLCIGLLSGFIIAPIIVFLYFIATYSLLAVTFLANVLTISDNLKKGLIIAGSILATTGFILELIATW